VSRRVCAIGIDVGGTNISGGAVTTSGRVIARQNLPTRVRETRDDSLASCVRMAKELADTATDEGYEVVGVGIGVPELVDRSQQIRSGEAIDWREADVHQALSGVGVTFVESDVRAAALGEALFGAGHQFCVFLYVTVGTGISHALVCDRQPFPGAHGYAILLGSAPWTTTCPVCGAEETIVLERYASGPALAARYRAMGRQARSAEEVMHAALDGDRSARDVCSSAGAAVGVGIAFLVNALDPEAVVIGGGLGLAGGIYWDALVLSVRRHVWAPDIRALPILPAGLGLDAGLVGAAATVLRVEADSSEVTTEQGRETAKDAWGSRRELGDPDPRPQPAARRSPRSS
jgi:glucokinase